MKKRLNPILDYTAAGFIFGLIFPLGATLFEMSVNRSGFSLYTFFSTNLSNPLIMIINTAPLFLGGFAYLAGAKQKKLQDQADRLEETVEKRSKEILRQKIFYEALVQSSPLAIVTLDREHRIVAINPAFQEMFGYRQEEIMGQELDALVANPDRPQEAVRITEGVLKGSSVHEYGRRRRRDGSLIDVEIFGQPILINGNLSGVLGMYRDITVEKEAQDALSASEERFRRMFSDSPVALRMEDFSGVKRWIAEKTENGQKDLHAIFESSPALFSEMAGLAKIVDLNDASLLLFQARDKQQLQENLHSILSCESRQTAMEMIYSMLEGVTSLEREMVYQRLDGEKIYTITKLSIVPGNEETWGRVLFSNMDITERKLAEERLTYISLHDMMTGIYNRSYFEEEMRRLDRSRLHPLSVLVGDMDNLKSINDRLGHQAGDFALKKAADIIKDCFRSEDVVARIGGDEIAVLLPGMDSKGAGKAAERIQENIARYNGDNTGIPISFSFGWATAEKGQLLETAFKEADERMYAQKEKKKNSV